MNAKQDNNSETAPSKNPADGRSLGIAVVGAGTVGGGVLDILHAQQEILRRRCGYQLQVSAVVKRNLADAAHLSAYADVLTDDWQQAVAKPETDIIVELMGGMSDASRCIHAALAAGKPVVTANKALLAETSGGADDLLAAAAAQGLPLAHEAAIAGCIPVVKILREALAGDSVEAVYGVINGTCNYILTKMEAEQCSFAAALAAAQRLGYAEAEPALDIDGIDAAHKLLLIARMAFACRPVFADIPVQGVRDFDYRDIIYARQFSYRIKLLAIARQGETAGQLELRVRPVMLPAAHIMASVEQATNAVVIRSRFAGETMYYGAGAGAHPTAVAVVADILDIARGFGERSSHRAGLPAVAESAAAPAAVIARRGTTPYYLRLRVKDRSGVIADISRLLADRNISIEAIHQNESAPEEEVDIIILLHDSADDKVSGSIAAIEQLETVTAPVVAIPIERLL